MSDKPTPEDARCHGDKRPLCITCGRLTYRRDVPLIEARPYVGKSGIEFGVWLCEQWRPT